jgi:Tfp pilus assembly protein PilV
MTDKNSDTSGYQVVIAILVIVVVILGVVLIKSHERKTGSANQGQETYTTTDAKATDTPPETQQSNKDEAPAVSSPKVTCKDVTSYDHNWDNDVLCTNPDGSTFYTDYAGGRKYGYDF